MEDLSQESKNNKTADIAKGRSGRSDADGVKSVEDRASQKSAGHIEDPLLTFQVDFADFDKNKDGFLTADEFEIVENDKSYDSELRRVAGLLKRDIKSVEEYSNDEWFDENDGATVKDLEKMRASTSSVPQPGIGNWFRQNTPSFDGVHGIGIVPIPDPQSWGESKVATRILHVYKGSAAEYAGLQSGDLIKQVDGRDVTEMKHSDVLDLIDGPRGTRVSLQVERDGKLRSIAVERKRQISTDTPKTIFDTGAFGRSRAGENTPGSPTFCQPNSEYAKIIRKAAFEHYDPFSLGDLRELTHKYDCVISSSEDAHKKAQSELSRLTGDTYTNIQDAKEVEEQEAKKEVKKEVPPDVVEDDLGDGIVYLKLTDFKDRHDSDRMKEAIQRNKDAEAFVIDLRGNPGGLFNEAIEIASMFIPEGEIVRTHARENSDPADPRYVDKNYRLTRNRLQTEVTDIDGDTEVDEKHRQRYLIDGRPVVVLIDRTSASSAEVFSGALKDNGVATLVGRPSFGKGIGQSTFRINDQHSLKLTTFRFTTPSGVWPGNAGNKRYGIKPDVDIYQGTWIKAGSDRDKQLQEAVSILNQKLQP